jgi:hypothetical protein
MRIGRTLLAAASAVMLAGIGSANAQTNVPGAKALDSIDKNLAKDPDNRGLANARDRIERNQKRHALHKADKAEDKAERAEKAEKMEKVEHVEKVDRPERPAHPDRPGR